MFTRPVIPCQKTIHTPPRNFPLFRLNTRLFRIPRHIMHSVVSEPGFHLQPSKTVERPQFILNIHVASVDRARVQVTGYHVQLLSFQHTR